MAKGKYLTPTKLVILLFGGIRPLARTLKINHSAVSQWQNTKDQGIPRKHHASLLEIAKKRNIELSLEDLAFGRTIAKTEIYSKKLDKRIIL